MWKKQKSIFFGLLLLLALLFLPSVGSAQVVLTDEEARTLGHELAIAKASIQNSREQINQSKTRLEQALNDLEQQKKGLIVQNVQLNAANKSLELLNQEHKRQVHRISRQRNFAYVIAALLVTVTIRK